MQENRELELDQLWYTWSTYGLGGMQRGFRVRAASEGFHDLGMRYRLVNRFLSCDLPEGTLPSEFTTRIAPVSLSFIDNGQERLLIRKVFTGLDAVGRNGVFFTHLIAGLPPEFTARDAIRLWYCPGLWVESEQEQSPNDTFLEKIPYSRIRFHVERSETGFNFAPVSEYLQSLILRVLYRGLPQHIRMRGHTTLIAELIYGLTHTLPEALLPDLTFTTYESQEQEGEPTTILGTVNWKELQDMARVQIQPGLPTGPIPPDLLHYTTTAVNALADNNTLKLYNLIDELDRRLDESDRRLDELERRLDKLDRRVPVTVDDLIELYKRRYRLTPLTLIQMESAFQHPADNLEDLLDSAFAAEATQLLLNNPQYWEPREKEIFLKVVSWLHPGARLNQQTQEALRSCIRSMADYHLFTAIQNELLGGTVPQHEMAIIVILAHPSTNPDLYNRMLSEFAQGPIYTQITSDPLWNFYIWLLGCAKLMTPLPTQDHILPWLRVSSWGKLYQELKLGLPTSWEFQAMYELVNQKREIPKMVITVVKMHEAKFIAFMQDLLQKGSQPERKQNYIDTVLRLFAALIQHDYQATEKNEPDYIYPNRINLLLPLLNAVPNDSQVIESVISIIPYASHYQLSMIDFDAVVAGCRPEVLAAGGASPSFMRYLLEYILNLTPKKLNPNTISLLIQFQRTSDTLPKNIASLVNSWLDIYTFLTKRAFDDEALQQVRTALRNLVPLLKEGKLNIRQEFFVELIPYLLTLIENEYQLGTVLAVFEGAQIASSWNLLTDLAPHVGTAHAENLHLLFPYVIVGIRECLTARLTTDALDSYLQMLLGRISEVAFGDIDRAMSARVFPELIINEWKGWLKRSKPSLFERFKSVWPFQQPKSPAEQQPDKKAPPTLSSKLPAQPGTNHAPSTYQGPKDPLTPDKFPALQSPDTKDPVVVTATANNQPINFTNSHYQNLHLAFTRMLPYWGQVLNNKLAKGHIKSIALEAFAIDALLNELTLTPVTTISEKLIQYLAEDTLIDLAISELRKGKNPPSIEYLNPISYITEQRKDFQDFLGTAKYNELCQRVSAKIIDDVLYILIRRYHFILYLESDSNKKAWDNWLSKAKRSVKIDYPRPAKK